MKQGKTVQELAAEINRQQLAKKDYVVGSDLMEMSERNSTMVMEVPSLKAPTWNIQALAHNQIAEFAGIPTRYYDRMQREAPGLLASNVNHWLHEKHAPRMVRTLDGSVRAFLSNRYLRLDHTQMMNHVMPVLSDTEAEIRSADVTPTRLYIKAVIPKMEGEIKKGDVVRFGAVFTNSEVGMGRVKVEPFIERLVCINGMILARSEFGFFERTHLGGEQDLTVEGGNIFASDTLEADSQATWLKVRDIMKTFLNPERMADMLELLRRSTEHNISGDVPGAVQQASKALELTQDEESGVLRYLIAGGDLSQWGLANAITRAAADSTSYDRATEIEAAGGQLLALKPTEWKQISEASAN